LYGNLKQSDSLSLTTAHGGAGIFAPMKLSFLFVLVVSELFILVLADFNLSLSGLWQHTLKWTSQKQSLAKRHV